MEVLKPSNLVNYVSCVITKYLLKQIANITNFADPLVVIPSIYLIGLEGSPLEVIGGLVDPAVLLSRAQKALELHLASQNTPVPAQVTNNQS